MLLKKRSAELSPSSTLNENAEIFGLLSDVIAENVEWLWEPFIPFGMLTILEGDPNLGKSFVMMDLAARLSTRQNLPNGRRLLKGKTLYINGEDDPAYTIRPRIEALGGDPSQIRYMKNFISFDPDGLASLEAEINSFKPDLIIIDPIFSFIPQTADMLKSNQIRPFLYNLTKLSKIVPSAFVLMRHLRKSGGDNALHNGSGVIDFIAVARSAVRVFKDPEDGDVRIFAHLKHSVSERGKSWSFEIVKDGESGRPRVQWIGECDLTVDDQNGGGEEKRDKLAEAKAFLENELASGPVSVTVLQDKALKQDHSKRTLDRAKSKLGVVADKVGNKWVWILPKKKQPIDVAQDHVSTTGDNSRRI